MPLIIFIMNDDEETCMSKKLKKIILLFFSWLGYLSLKLSIYFVACHLESLSLCVYSIVCLCFFFVPFITQ